MINTSDFKNGLYIMYQGEINQIVKFQHVNPGKGSAFVRTKLKELKTGKVVDYTFKSGEKFEEAYVETNNSQYLYDDGSNYVFMDNVTFEQFEIPHQVLEEESLYLVEGLEVLLLKKDGIPITIRLPRKMELKVKFAPPGVKGDTATSATKQITLENGMEINAPLFIKKDDKVVVNTDTGEYVERV